MGAQRGGRRCHRHLDYGESCQETVVSTPDTLADLDTIIGPEGSLFVEGEAGDVLNKAFA